MNIFPGPVSDDLEEVEHIPREATYQPPLRSKNYLPKPPTVEKASGSSSWVGKPREGFTSTFAERSREMSNSKEGRRVSPPILGMKRTQRGINE